MDKMARDKADNDQKREHHDGLRSERDTRSNTRSTHLEAGRELARSENARARDRNSSQTENVEEGSEDS